MSEKIYHCKYGLSLECGEFHKEDVDVETHGLTDAFVLVSILREGEHAHDGAKSTAIVTYDGQTGGGEIPDTELFQVWSFLANKLMTAEGCPAWQRDLARESFAAVRKHVTGMETH
jgi:hypothetical protein